MPPVLPDHTGPGHAGVQDRTASVGFSSVAAVDAALRDGGAFRSRARTAEDRGPLASRSWHARRSPRRRPEPCCTPPRVMRAWRMTVLVAVAGCGFLREPSVPAPMPVAAPGLPAGDLEHPKTGARRRRFCAKMGTQPA